MRFTFTTSLLIRAIQASPNDMTVGVLYGYLTKGKGKATDTHKERVSIEQRREDRKAEN